MENGLQIPERYYPGIKKLAAISRQTADELLSALRQAVPSLYVQKLAMEVSKKVKSLPTEDIAEIVKSVLSLYDYLDYSGIDVEDLVKQISLIIKNDEDVKDFTENRRTDFEEQLTNFLKLDGVLGITSKAIGVMKDHERLYINSRVLTDIRPIFGRDAEEDPAGVVLVHMLKIEYRDLDGLKEFFVAMDPFDVQDLFEQLIRAEKKSDSIRSMLEKTGVSFIDLGEGSSI